MMGGEERHDDDVVYDVTCLWLVVTGENASTEVDGADDAMKDRTRPAAVESGAMVIDYFILIAGVWMEMEEMNEI